MSSAGVIENFPPKLLKNVDCPGKYDRLLTR